MDRWQLNELIFGGMAKMNTKLRYSEPDLVKIIAQLPEAACTSFAAACAQRLFPAYVKYGIKTGNGAPDELGDILARLWRDLIDEPMSDAEVDSNIARCMELIPGDDEQPPVPEKPAAQNAASAVAYALRCRKSHHAQEAGWAARMAYEALDNHVISEEEVDINAPGAEESILLHPVIQAELGRQQRDLDELLSGKIDPPQLRHRAMAESAEFLPG